MGRKYLILVHISFWIYVFVIMEVINKLAYQKQWFDPSRLLEPLAISNYVIFAIIFYLNYFGVLPAFLQKKKYFLSILSWILLVILFVAFRYFIQEYLLMHFFGLCNYCSDNIGIYFANNFFQGFSILIMASTVIWFIDNWLKMERLKLSLEQEKIYAERAFLQSQVNPHFLFNTLNNIYSMVFHNSPGSLTAIQKLADIMRYSLKENNSVVDLSLEITYLKNYIDLQKLRVKKPAVEYEEKVDYPFHKIVPMLLISFVENAFKHGVINDERNPLTIKLHVEKSRLVFFVHNLINQTEPDHSSGIGSNSVKRRLDLFYSSSYQLSVEKIGGFYSSELILKL